MLVTPHVTLKYINAAGRDMSFNYFYDFVIEKCIEEQPNNIYSVEQDGIDGEFFTGMRMGKRSIRLLGYVKNSGTSLHTVKQALGYVFNPTLSGVLHYSHALMPRASKSIPCRLTELSEPVWDNKRGKLTFDILLTALDPYWRGNAHTEVIAKNQRKWRFPTRLPARPRGFVFDVRRSGLTSIFQNIGNVRTGFEATLRAVGGTVVNPEIYDVTSGKRLVLNLTMQPADVVHIINFPLLKRVFINSVNGFSTLNTRAENFGFFLINVGENHIGFRAEENVSNLQVSIRYTPQFTFAEG